VTAWLLLVVGVLLAGAGTTVAVGTAAVSRIELARWVSQRLRGAEIATALLSAPGRVLGAATALASAGITLAAFGLAAALSPLPPAAAVLGLFVVAVPALAVLVFALPRALGRRWAEPIVRAAAPWLDRTVRVAGPLLPRAAAPARADLSAAIRPAAGDAPLRVDDLTMIAGVIAFTERPVREVMTPRTEIVAVEEGAPLSEIAMIFAESGYSRIPVYRGSLDQIIGMIYAFDLLQAEGAAAPPIRPVAVVPSSRRCSDLLFEMQREGQQFAVVLDEFGGTAGIATFEDLLEELVGEIFDERDAAWLPESPPVELAEVDGTTPLEELAARFDLPITRRAETVGGLLTASLGRIPRLGERIVLDGLEFDVLAATATRVERVIVRRAPVAAVQPAAPDRGHA